MEKISGTLASVLTLGLYEPMQLMKPDGYHKSTPRALSLIYDNVHCFFDEHSGRTISQATSINESNENIKGKQVDVRVLHGWYIYPKKIVNRLQIMDDKSAQKVILVCPDFEGNMSHHLNLLHFITETFPECAVLFFDYVGFGLSMSEHTSPNVDLCFRSAWQAVKYLLLEKQIDKSNLTLWGIGHGCTIAAYLINLINGRCRLIMENPPPVRFSDHVRQNWTKTLHTPWRLTSSIFRLSNELDLEKHIDIINQPAWLQNQIPVLTIVTQDDKAKCDALRKIHPTMRFVHPDKYDRGSLFLVKDDILRNLERPPVSNRHE